MELATQEETNSLIPQLFWDGGEISAILMRQAFKDLDYCWCLGDVVNLFGVPAIGLMARIRRYTEGRQLIIPEQLNWEEAPFMAIKFAYCEDWEKFRDEKKSVDDLTHLRAYFWDQDTEREKLMCITHFKIKTQAKLDPEDTRISRMERDHFLGTNCHYSDEKWEIS